MSDRVARVRKLLSEATHTNTRPREANEDRSRRAFEYFELNSEPAIAVAQSPRARSEREIMRIANWYGWSGEVSRALDQEAVSTLPELSEKAIDRLLERMRRLEDCAQQGLDPPDSAPAR